MKQKYTQAQLKLLSEHNWCEYLDPDNPIIKPLTEWSTEFLMNLLEAIKSNDINITSKHMMHTNLVARKYWIKMIQMALYIDPQYQRLKKLEMI